MSGHHELAVRAEGRPQPVKHPEVGLDLPTGAIHTEEVRLEAEPPGSQGVRPDVG